MLLKQAKTFLAIILLKLGQASSFYGGLVALYFYYGENLDKVV